jgi:hypothetical protein
MSMPPQQSRTVRERRVQRDGFAPEGVETREVHGPVGRRLVEHPAPADAVGAKAPDGGPPRVRDEQPVPAGLPVGGEGDGLRRGGGERRQGAVPVERVAAAPAGPGVHRESGLLERGGVALPGADGDPEAPGRGAGAERAPGARAELLDEGMEPVRSVHAINSHRPVA